MEHLEPVKVFEHCRLILGMVLSLAIARLLNGVARFVQHPKKVKIFLPHLLWVVTVLLQLIHFWWWEFKLAYYQNWVFEVYLMLIIYAVDIFLLAALLFPDDMSEYSGFEDYFMSRRKWFFALLGFSFIIDFWDTALKGMTYFHSLGWEYPVRNVSFIAMCVAAMLVTSRKIQLAFVTIALVYELSFIFRMYHSMQ